MIISLRTDSPLVNLSLLTKDGHVVAEEKWQADRTLADNLHTHLNDLLARQNSGWEEVEGIIVYRGPGSFTGLRIGITVVNALGYGLNVPVIGETGETWQETAIARLKNGQNDKVVLPHYGADPHITSPRK